MSETMNLCQVPEITTLDRALWAGRIMSAFVVTALVADGTIQLFAPSEIASARMKCASVLRQLHAARRPVQEPDTDIFFQLPDRR